MKTKIAALFSIMFCLSLFCAPVRTIMVDTNGNLAASDTNFFRQNLNAAIAAGLGGSGGGTNGGTPALAGTNMVILSVGGSNQFNVPVTAFDAPGAALAASNANWAALQATNALIQASLTNIAVTNIVGLTPASVLVTQTNAAAQTILNLIASGVFNGNAIGLTNMSGTNIFGNTTNSIFTPGVSGPGLTSSGITLQTGGASGGAGAGNITLHTGNAAGDPGDIILQLGSGSGVVTLDNLTGASFGSLVLNANAAGLTNLPSSQLQGSIPYNTLTNSISQLIKAGANVTLVTNGDGSLTVSTVASSGLGLPLNPYQFGATGLPGSDDSIAFSNFVAALNTSTNRRGDLLTGYYNIAKGAPYYITNWNVELFSSGGATLLNTNNSDTLIVNGDATSIHDFNMGGCGTNWPACPNNRAIRTDAHDLNTDYAQHQKFYNLQITNFSTDICVTNTSGTLVTLNHLTAFGYYGVLCSRADECQIIGNNIGFCLANQYGKWGTGNAFSETNSVAVNIFPDGVTHNPGIKCTVDENEIGKVGKFVYGGWAGTYLLRGNDFENAHIFNTNFTLCEFTNCALVWDNNSIGVNDVGLTTNCLAVIGIYNCAMDKVKIYGPIYYTVGGTQPAIPALDLLPQSAAMFAPYADALGSGPFLVHVTMGDTPTVYSAIRTLPNLAGNNTWFLSQQFQHSYDLFGANSGANSLTAGVTKEYFLDAWAYTSPGAGNPSLLHYYNYAANAGYMEVGGANGNYCEQTVYIVGAPSTAVAGARSWAFDATSGNGDLLPQTSVNIGNSGRGVNNLWVTNPIAFGPYIGNAGSLTNLNAANLTGTVPAAVLPSNIVTNNYQNAILLTNLSNAAGASLTSSNITWVNGNIFFGQIIGSSYYGMTENSGALGLVGNQSSPTSYYIVVNGSGAQSLLQVALGGGVQGWNGNRANASGSSSAASANILETAIGTWTVSTNLITAGYFIATNGIVLAPVSSYSAPVCTNGLSVYWNSNGVTYHRASSVGGTTWTDTLQP